MDKTFTIISLPSGEKTLRSVELGETYHPGIGPLPEAQVLHVGQQRIAERCRSMKKFVLWDVGLGAAANTVCALNAMKDSTAEIEIHSFDKTTNPLQFALSQPEALPYLNPYREAVASLLENKSVKVAKNISWHFHEGDFAAQLDRRDLPSPSSIFYDPYSPAMNCDMWTLSHFTKLYRHLEGDCLLTNYSRSTRVRITLLMAGFCVGVGCSIGTKRETTVATNRPELLAQPLTPSFLERVRISRNSAPLHRSNYDLDEKISPEDYSLLARHPQFCT